MTAWFLGAWASKPRSPFPQGYVLEQGDWSLLDVGAATDRTSGGMTAFSAGER